MLGMVTGVIMGLVGLGLGLVDLDLLVLEE